MKLLPGHEGNYHLKDLKYIARITQKIANEFPRKAQDIDWCQLFIEAFSIVNSRVYEALIPRLIDECSNYQQIPKANIKSIVKRIYKPTLSFSYHKNRRFYRNRAAHDSNYLRVGIIEFQSDVLAKPINYHKTQDLENMAQIKDFILMWRRDITRCSKEISLIINTLIKTLNQV